MYSINLYEQWVFDAVSKAGLQVFIPYKDKGVDAVLTDGSSKFLRIQVKGSRSFVHPDNINGWYVINPDKLEKSASMTDLWVFVWGEPGKGGAFEPQFVALPPKDLYARYVTRTIHNIIDEEEPSKDGRWHIYLGRVPGRSDVVDFRGLTNDLFTQPPKQRIYSSYVVRNWKDTFDSFPQCSPSLVGGG
jgi:hypothetical protein